MNLLLFVEELEEDIDIIEEGVVVNIARERKPHFLLFHIM